MSKDTVQIGNPSRSSLPRLVAAQRISAGAKVATYITRTDQSVQTANVNLSVIGNLHESLLRGPLLCRPGNRIAHDA